MGIKTADYFVKQGRDKSYYIEQIFISIDKCNKISNMKAKGKFLHFNSNIVKESLPCLKFKLSVSSNFTVTDLNYLHWPEGIIHSLRKTVLLYCHDFPKQFLCRRWDESETSISRLKRQLVAAENHAIENWA